MMTENEAIMQELEQKNREHKEERILADEKAHELFTSRIELEF